MVNQLLGCRAWARLNAQGDKCHVDIYISDGVMYRRPNSWDLMAESNRDPTNKTNPSLVVDVYGIMDRTLMPSSLCILQVLWRATQVPFIRIGLRFLLVVEASQMMNPIIFRAAFRTRQLLARSCMMCNIGTQQCGMSIVSLLCPGWQEGTRRHL